MRLFRWPAAPLMAVATGIAMLGAPAAIEGPILLPISPGHALSVLDSVAVLPLLIGTTSLYVGLWRRRAGLERIAQRSTAGAGTMVFAGGLGLGLLIASAFSAFFWWWAVGAVLFGAVLLSAVLAVRDRSGDGAESP